ncbi:MAG: hypothetical protein HZB53_13475 [Chloroflexi bacterium]|nr:hypothetical protein [Chloroflexota bacterium]
MRRVLAVLASCAAMAMVVALAGARIANAGLSLVNISNTSTDSRNPALIVAPSGAEHVVWEEMVDISPTLSVKYVWHRWWNGVLWSPAITVGTGSRAALAVGPGNTPHAVWLDDFGGSPSVFYSNWNGSTWAIPKQIASLTGSASQPVIVVDAANTVRVAWGQFDPLLPGYRLYYATATAGGAGAWSAVPLNGAAGGNAPSMAVDMTGTLHMAWQTGGFGNGEIYYGTLVNTNTVSIAENISQSPGIDSKWPSLALGVDARPVVVWGEVVSSQYDIMASVRGGGTWTTPGNLSNSAGADSGVPRLALTGSAMTVAWNEATATPSIMWALGSGASWGPAKNLVVGGGGWQAVSLFGAPSGTAYYAYDGGSGPNGDVFADSLALARTFLPVIRR